jgi:hypothetical protein
MQVDAAQMVSPEQALQCPSKFADGIGSGLGHQR